jgi:hypothetical protein
VDSRLSERTACCASHSKARAAAKAQGVNIRAVHASDEEFDFGRDRWDLIAILYAIEKRSVFRVETALRPGGVVVVDGAYDWAPGKPLRMVRLVAQKPG